MFLRHRCKQENKARIDKWGSIKLKSSCAAKKMISRIKQSLQSRGNTCQLFVQWVTDIQNVECLCMCMCVSVQCVCVCHVCRCVCMCVEGRGPSRVLFFSKYLPCFPPSLPSSPLSFLSLLLLSSFSLPSFYLRRNLSLARSSPRRLDWPVSEPRDLPISTTSLTVGFQVCTTTLGFLCKLWESNSDPWAFAESIWWLSYLSSPKMYLLMVCIRSSHRHQCSGLDGQSATETLGGGVWVGLQVKAFAG